MKEHQYIKQLEDKLYELIKVVTDDSLYNFLSDSERTKIGCILKDVGEARISYGTP